jgi:hypothetical protein
MKVFLNHARKDNDLARELRLKLEPEGFSVWTAEDQVFPGDNWAKKVAKALEDSDLMVVLLTPRSFESEFLRQNVQFALGSKKYAERVFSVFVGPTMDAGKDVPWILLRLPNRQVESASEFGDVVRDIRNMSHAHA